jgi:hypothetical protein
MNLFKRFGNMDDIEDVPFDIGDPLPTRESRKALLARHRARQRALKRKPRQKASGDGLAYVVGVLWLLALVGMLASSSSTPVTFSW